MAVYKMVCLALLLPTGVQARWANHTPWGESPTAYRQSCQVRRLTNPYGRSTQIAGTIVLKRLRGKKPKYQFVPRPGAENPGYGESDGTVAHVRYRQPPKIACAATAIFFERAIGFY